MAIAILSSPDYLQPVYSIQEYELYDSANYSEAGFYYQLDVSVNGQSRTLKVKKDENNKATFDVQAILQAFIESSIDETKLESGSIFQAYTGTEYVTPYQVRASAIWDGGSSVGSYTSAKLVFNGVDQYNRTWDASLYEFRAGNSGLWITDYHGPRTIHFEDLYRLTCLYSGANGIDSSFNGVSYTRYQLNGDSSTQTYDTSIGTTGLAFFSIAADPSTLNAQWTGFIDENTEYFTVAESTGLSETIRINIAPLDSRYDRYYRFYYVGTLGQIEAFNFDLVPENDIKISRTTYSANRQYKTFGTKVDDEYLVRSNWICEDESAGLKSLWHSPLIKIYEDNSLIPIVILDTSKKILNQHNSGGLISYTLNFKYADDYVVQFQ